MRSRYWLRMCQAVGQHVWLAGRPSINVEGGQVRIGDRFRLASRPVPSHLVAGSGAVLDIGDDVSIGAGAAIAAFEQVRIGNGTRIGPYVIIMDTNFHGAPGDQSVQHDTRPVTIGDGCRIGSRVTITRGVSIGDGAEILAGSVVSTEIPPGACAGGGRARVIGQAGEMNSRWESLSAVFPELLIATLGVDSLPHVDERDLPAQFWTDEAVRSLVGALEDRFHVTIEAATIRRARTASDVFDIAQRAIDARKESEGSL